MAEVTPAPANETEVGIVELMEGRSTMYALLARAFHTEVDAAFFEQLNTMRYPQNSPNPAINEAFKRIYAYMRHARADETEVLAGEFARIFLGSGVLNGNAAFPYESVYTSSHGLVMQEARDEVLAVYRSQGIDKDETWKDPEDHIALELEFMGVLSRRCGEAVAAGDDEAAKSLVKTQYCFLTDHMLNWAPRFLGDIKKYAEVDFYPAFAALATAWLEDEKVLLEDIAESSKIDLTPEPIIEDPVEEGTDA